MAEVTQAEMLQRAFRFSISDAGFVSHVAMLGLSGANYTGKRVLDIGSGRTNRFAIEAPEFIADAFIVPVNPQLAFDDICKEREISREAHLGGVAALAQGFLPFTDESFDTVVSVLGVPNTLMTEELPDFYNDVWRILKPGGVASFWPFAHHRTEGNVMVDQDAGWVESVDPKVLKMLPEPYCDVPQRLMIYKPEEDNLPATIAYLESS
jgi:SAM-dependent methyltransferase